MSDARAALDAVMTERQLQDAVIGCAQSLGYAVYHTYDSRRSQLGFPDLVLVRAWYSGPSPRVVFVELKSATGRLSPAQVTWRAVIQDAGGEYHLWRPADWSSGEIERVLA